jgi:RHH-type rel operon transcriptional repressor/antitoxin RelB
MRMARISLRLEDDVHDRLLIQARRSGTTLSDLIRAAAAGLVDPQRPARATAHDAQMAFAAIAVSLALIDHQERSPAFLSQGIVGARALLLQWGMSEQIADPLLASMGQHHVAQSGASLGILTGAGRNDGRSA